MLAKRIIPCLDVKAGRVVKGVNFVDLVDAGDPVGQARFYEGEGADELVFLDITASADRRKTMVELAARTADQVFMPFIIGGGITTLEEIRDILKAGADKISLNTAAVLCPDLVNRAAARFGSQCVVVAIDAKRKTSNRRRKTEDRVPTSDLRPPTSVLRPPTSDIRPPTSDLNWEVYIHGGRTATGKDALTWAREAATRGAGEILLTSMDGDGTLNGYDLELTAAVGREVDIPVIASGGAGGLEHLYQALTIGRAQAVLAASIFHFRTFSIQQAKEYLREQGVSVRM